MMLASPPEGFSNLALAPGSQVSKSAGFDLTWDPPPDQGLAAPAGCAVFVALFLQRLEVCDAALRGLDPYPSTATIVGTA